MKWFAVLLFPLVVLASHESSPAHHRLVKRTISTSLSLPSSFGPWFKAISTARKCKYQLDTAPGKGYSGGGNSPNAHYCGSNSATKPKFVYWYANADVDCDGTTAKEKNKGKCKHDPDWTDDTTFTNKNGGYLDATKIPYAVLSTKDFDPTKFGIKGLAAGFVYCRERHIPIIYGDTDSEARIGELAISVADACFPSDTANSAAPNNILYVLFTGEAAVDPNAGSNPAALSKLVNKLIGGMTFNIEI